MDRDPTRTSTSWISWIAIVGGLATGIFQLYAVLALGVTAASVVALATSAALIVLGAWAREVSRRLPR